MSLHLGGWLAVGAVVFAWGVSARGALLAGLDELIWVLTGIALTLGFRVVYRRALSAAVAYPWLGLLIVFISVGGALVWYEMYVAVLRILYAMLMQWVGVDSALTANVAGIALQSWAIPLRTLIICGCLLLTWSTLYFGINAIIDLEVERERAAGAQRLADRARLLADRARLSALQAQLNPHFIFNALNGVTTLIREMKADAAATMVSTLSNFLRGTLRTVNRPELTVSEELVFVDQYFELQQLRFADRLRFHIDAAEETYAALLPTLILQPLVENAVVHGALSQGRGGEVRVAIHRSGADLIVAVEDNGPGGDHPETPTYGVGLGNTEERLSALYGEAGTLSIGKSAAGGFAVMLRMPYREAGLHVSSAAVGAQ